MDCTPFQKSRIDTCHRGGRTWTETEEERKAKGGQRKSKGKSNKQTSTGGRSYAGAGDRRRECRAREGEVAHRVLAGLVLIIHSQKRLERIERLKDDPYYIFDKKEL